MRNATLPKLLRHLESYTLCSGIHKAGENSINHATSCENQNIGQN